MDAYINLLKELYYKERKKLEELPIFSNEGKLRFFSTRKDILDKIRKNLRISQMLERVDITQAAKEDLLRDRDKADKIEENIEKTIERELLEIENEEKEGMEDARYSAADFAEYIIQLERVGAIEAELENNRLFPGEVYVESQETKEGDK